MAFLSKLIVAIIGIICAYALYAHIALAVRFIIKQYRLYGANPNDWDYDSYWNQFNN